MTERTELTADPVLVSALTDWAAAAIRMLEAGEASVVGADIDELPSKPPYPRPLRRGALAAFLEMVERVPELLEGYAAMLALPIESWNSTRLPTRYPSLDRVLDDPMTRFNVPAFYIASRGYWADARLVGDGFRQELPLAVETTPPVVLYYSANRPRLDRERGWEFIRSFYVRTLAPDFGTDRLGFVESVQRGATHSLRQRREDVRTLVRDWFAESLRA